jgi:hypothetical protein
LPFPALPYLFLATLSKSGLTPNFLSKARTSLVFSSLSKFSTTKGISGTSSTLCPLAKTIAGTAELANAEAVAYLLYSVLIFLCHLLHVLLGANICPPLHMLPKAP